MTYTLEEKKAILSELIIMAHADQHIKKEEIAFIHAIGKRLELDEKELSHMLEHPEELETMIPKQFVKRVVHFHRLMLMMHIDGHVDAAELQLLYQTALRYGIRKSTVDTLLNTMEKYPHGEIPPSELMSIHQRNHN
ncbi:hypothetical protein [Nonlabens ulvanivorans]|uniref:hypothetical protein n=1 Tax=Nonlabens ulvanivorans TaxID=906888 RepID=UPI0029423392|nr:hypothetical protein [Nonlabens ulvanivorans]WOI23660.1 hypothetical protein R1T42_04205 [Nonlabens ulvanivorans]